MRYFTDSKVNWWATAHILAIFGQLSLCVVSIICFAFTRPSNYDDHIPSDDEFWDDVSTRTILPWAAAAVGGFTTFVNIVLFIVLWKTCGPNQQPRLTRPTGGYRNAVIVGCIILSLVLVADIILAVKSGLARQDGICGTASAASLLTITAICADLLRLQKLYRDRKENIYFEELGRVSEDSMSGPLGAPPPYEAMTGAR
ncbi:hypothetical protein F4804DRAFT_216481 [Jackrogersella minutella]|nr:hypothetical protein F4804DRAFT_216481 [Jackrogersella minutella]